MGGTSPLNLDSWEIDKVKVSTRNMFDKHQDNEETLPNSFIPKWYDGRLWEEWDIVESVSYCFS
ncbi:hypothetical protein [Helicobacter sp. MIT 05-5294]|uniref:hypothetical protein n=1 Tax=Helicobacter sp. MIT 05-5294 TaxID=1548150 RepID=UPI00051FD942|nr:hypothetical protein [Helicobacter sp. MIT 05-5294]TLD86206.1 hypothetical protein LS69_006865 [Helicobacter sp. MIT 05-5294]